MGEKACCAIPVTKAGSISVCAALRLLLEQRSYVLVYSSGDILALTCEHVCVKQRPKCTYARDFRLKTEPRISGR